MNQGCLIVVSAPSGGGKTTLCNRLLAERSDVVRSVSCTTRAPRGSERDGRDYHFVTPDEFESLLARDEFLEHAKVHGFWYGTLWSTVEEFRSRGKHVLMVIDVQGAAQVRDWVRGRGKSIGGVRFFDVFIRPPSLEVLVERLTNRREDDADTIRRRLANARCEMERSQEFKYVIVNDDLERGYADLRRVVAEELDHHG